MYRPIDVIELEDLARFCSLPGLSSLSPEIVCQHRPDNSLLLLDEAGNGVARCSLW